jgi:hypothetical protein
MTAFPAENGAQMYLQIQLAACSFASKVGLLGEFGGSNHSAPGQAGWQKDGFRAGCDADRNFWTDSDFVVGERPCHVMEKPVPGSRETRAWGRVPGA